MQRQDLKLQSALNRDADDVDEEKETSPPRERRPSVVDYRTTLGVVCDHV